MGELSRVGVWVRWWACFPCLFIQGGGYGGILYNTTLPIIRSQIGREIGSNQGRRRRRRGGKKGVGGEGEGEGRELGLCLSGWLSTK